jgi:hypothetical protein
MEKIENPLLRRKKQKLPYIVHNKSTQLLNQKLTDRSMSPPNHLQELRKLYYQYKSNANILAHSPYYTNRTHQQNVVSYIQANKCHPTCEQLQTIEDKFTIHESLSDKISSSPSPALQVKLHCFNVVLELQLKAKTVEELEMLLKK